MVLSPGVLEEQVTLADDISKELNTIDARLKLVQRDVRQLIALDDPHLMLAEGNRLRGEMDTLARMVLNGGIDPNTGKAEKGVARRSQRSFAALRMTARACPERSEGTPLKPTQVLSPNVSQRARKFDGLPIAWYSDIAWYDDNVCS